MHVVERNLPHLEKHEEIKPQTSQESAQDIGRVASATLFDSKAPLQLPPGRAKINGHDLTINHSYEVSSLVRTNPHSSELEVDYQHSAHIVGLLEGHMAVQKYYKERNEQPPNRPFVFIDVTGGEYRDMTLVAVEGKRRDRRLEHTAVFAYPTTPDAKGRPEFEVIAIDDIYGISYALPKEPVEI